MSPQLREPGQRTTLRASADFLERSRRVIPGCSQTFSKGPSQFVQGIAPVFLRRASGSHVWDVDGNEYIDYPMALGPVVLGHGDPDVTAAVQKQLEDGVAYSLPHPLEVEVAERLTEVVPCAEMVRFGKNGSDATAGAVRAARAYTGRDLIACCGYHGWQDWYIGTTTRHRGVPGCVRDLTLTFVYNDIASLERLFAQHPGRIAAVIMEPVGIEEPHGEFLQRVAEITRSHGALLVFDEVLTGFRLALGGGQEHFGITPDLACFAKAMANGFPLSAVVGRRGIMEIFDEIFFSFTHGGEALSLAACRATIEKMKRVPVIDHLWGQGRRLQEGINAMAADLGLGAYVRCQGLPPRTVVLFRDSSGAEFLILRSLFQQEVIKRGVLFLVGFNLSWAHSDLDVERTLEACRGALGVLRDALDRGEDRVGRFLEGPPVQPVFRQA